MPEQPAVSNLPPQQNEETPGTRPSSLTSGEVVRAALNRVKAAARAQNLRPGMPGSPSRKRRSPAADNRGAYRDPQLLGGSLGSLLADMGWSEDVAVGGVIGRWREVVGEQIADHCTPEVFEGSVLTVRADSTAWATQVRLLTPTLLRRLGEELGEGVVAEVKVLGPAGPSFKRGPRSVPGPGPRDTWG